MEREGGSIIYSWRLNFFLGYRKRPFATHLIRRRPVPGSAQQHGFGRETWEAGLVISVRGDGPPGVLMRSRPEAGKCRNKSHLFYADRGLSRI